MLVLANSFPLVKRGRERILSLSPSLFTGGGDTYKFANTTPHGVSF
jgi:hypothetical protein